MKAKNKKTRKALLLAIILVFLTGITVFAVVVTEIINSSNTSPSSNTQLIKNGSAMSGSFHEKSSSELLKELKKRQINVTDKISSQITFQNGKQGSIGSWVVENSSTNSVTEQCSVILNGETVAVSAPIKPGQHIENITLNSTVTPGTYSVAVSINYYNPETSTCLGQADYHNVKMVVS